MGVTFVTNGKYGPKQSAIPGRGSARRRIAVPLAAILGLALGLIGAGEANAATPAVKSPRPTVGSPTAGSLSSTLVDALPKDWSLAAGRQGDRLTWRAAQGAGDARVTFYAGDRRLGSPTPDADGRTYTLVVPRGSVTDPAALQARAGGRRVDAAGVSQLRKAKRSLTSEAAPRAAAPLPPVSFDPGTAGPYSTVTGEYSLASVRLPDFPTKVEMKAVVVAPKNASGKRPLVLILHGRHDVCYDGDASSWPCDNGTKEIPSYRGYLRTQQLLASQGYVTVSIAANGINAQDYASTDGGAQARSSLIRLHLGHWADWAGSKRSAAPAIVKQAPVADMSKVLLVGHSRGGEGVNRAAIDSQNPPPAAADGYHGTVRWTIRGLLMLAPTIFGHDPAADVPSVVVLPGCDGDVYDLQGQMTVDGTRGVGTGTALHSAVFVVGADHNFFNSEWTPGLSAAPSYDDWFTPDDAVCGDPASVPTSQRLTPVQQQQVGAVYVAAAARQFVQDDDRVLPLLDGSGVRAPSAGPARVLSAAVGANRTPFVQPAATVKASGTARLCREVAPAGAAAACLPEDSQVVPSFVPFTSVYDDPDRYAADVKWASAGATASLKPAKPVSLLTSSSVALRLIVPPNSAGTVFDVGVTDAAGNRAGLGRVTLDGLPGTASTVSHWGQEVRVPLTAARTYGLDLSKIASLQVTPRSATGQAYLLDAWGYGSGTPAVTVAPKSRIDVGQLDPVNEGSTTTTYRLPVAVSGDAGGTFRVFVEHENQTSLMSSLVTVRPGQHSADVKLTVKADDAFGYGDTFMVLARAVKGAVVGDFYGDLVVSDDDPFPTITATALNDSVTEGGTLAWRLTATPSPTVPLGIFVTFGPTTGPELSTDDVDPDWLRNEALLEPDPPVPFSTTGAYLYPTVPGGAEATVDVTVPTITDDRVEGPEQLHLVVDTGFQTPVDLLGTVNDAP